MHRLHGPVTGERLRPLVLVALLAAGPACVCLAAEPASGLGVGLAGSTIRQADDINLYGVVVARDGRQSIALLGIQDGQAFPYRPGDEVAASWRLLKVQGITVVVADPAGDRFRLAMLPDDGSGRRQAAARLPPIKPVSGVEATRMPTDEMLERARREFNLPASD